MSTEGACPDFVPDFGELQYEKAWWYASCERVHPDTPHGCIGDLAVLDQEYSAAREFDSRYASRPVIVGTYRPEKSAWRMEAFARIYVGDRAPGWSGVDPELVAAHNCDHLQISPRPAFRWAECPWWCFCVECHYALVATNILKFGLWCKRCRRALTADTMYNRALIDSDLLIAAVCQPCAKLFDSVRPRAADAPPPGTARYAARTQSTEITAAEFAEELRAAGAIKTQEEPSDYRKRQTPPGQGRRPT